MWSARYVRNAAGELVRVEDRARGTTRYELDGAGRLVAEVDARGERREWAHDAAGNLVRVPGVSLLELREANRLRQVDGELFEYNARHHVATRRSAAGTWRYAYDSLDQLVEARWEPAGDGPASVFRAEYDGLGRRVAKEWNGARTEYWWDGDRLAAERAPGGEVRVYVHAGIDALSPVGFVDYASVEAAPESGRAYAVFHDAQGLPLWIEDARGEVAWWAARIDPYGAVAVDARSAIAYAPRWPGHWWDEELGLQYNRFRYYEPRLGRYLETDPLDTDGGLNVFAAPPNPCVAVDLLGLAHDRRSRAGADGAEGEARPNLGRARRSQSQGDDAEDTRSSRDRDRRHHDDDAEDLGPVEERQVTPETLPLGFRSRDRFEQFGARLQSGFASAGYNDVHATMQGSSVTGVGHQSQQPFDAGRVSDYDVRIESPTMVARAREMGIPLNGPLRDKALAQLDLTDMHNDMYEYAKRPVEFLLVDPERRGEIFDRPSIPIPGGGRDDEGY